MNTPMIQIENLSVQFSGNRILKDVSLSINAGEYISILGPNGAGKTTLIKCIAGIHRNWSGEIRIGGHNFAEWSPKALAKIQSYVPQAEGRTIPLTVEQFIALGRYPHLSAFTTLNAEDHRAIDAAFALSGLESLRQRTLNTLSGGERQMAFIAAALAQETRILLLDEPSTFLDYQHQTRITQLLKNACRKHGKTVIAVHHDINTATACSDRIYALKNGTIEFEGTPAEIANAETLRQIYETDFTLLPSPRAPHPVIIAGGLA